MSEEDNTDLEFDPEEATDPEIRLKSDRPPPPKPKPRFGALEPLLQDPMISEIMINDVRNVLVERNGKIHFSGLKIPTPEDVFMLAESIAASTDKELSFRSPLLDASLPDGTRVHIVIPPLVPRAPCITIRKFPSQALSLSDLAARAMLDAKIATFLEACVRTRANLILSGGTGSGKTTLLNALLQLIPHSERIVLIEDAREIVLEHPNSVSMLTRGPAAGAEPVTARELVSSALRMRPDRLILGECRKAEAFDTLTAMNTGHEGSMTTIHANSPRDALVRLETLCMLAGTEMPHSALRRQVQCAVDLVVQVQRFRDGIRRVVSISELTGMEGEIITMQDIFQYDEAKRAFLPTGFVPTFANRLSTQKGLPFPPGFFS